MRQLITYLSFAMIPLIGTAYEQAFEKTAVDSFEIKTLPAARLIASQTDVAYFDGNNGLFRPLFRYIRDRDISMTTPVEAEIEPGVMYFYIGEDVNPDSLDSTEAVKVHILEERTVASYGVRGSYSERNFNEAAAKLSSWLEDNPSYQAIGEARGVFWNGPYVPGLFKRFEVHIPVRIVNEQNAS